MAEAVHINMSLDSGLLSSINVGESEVYTIVSEAVSCEGPSQASNTSWAEEVEEDWPSTSPVSKVGHSRCWL